MDEDRTGESATVPAGEAPGRADAAGPSGPRGREDPAGEADAAVDAARPPASDGAADADAATRRVPAIVDGEEHQVDARAVTVSRLVGIPSILGVALMPFIGVTIGWALGGVPPYVYFPLLLTWALATVVALAWAYKWPELHHRHLRYRVDDSGVRIRRGVLWRKVISIPTSRVQHTDVSQGPVQRQYELATLTVHTAGTEGAKISLEGLEEGIARRLRDHLLPEHEDDDDA